MKCEICGEPVVRVENPVDEVWRWRHNLFGVIRDHIAKPKRGGQSANDSKNPYSAIPDLDRQRKDEDCGIYRTA